MSKNTVCSYTRETGAPKTYEDSSWSTRTEISLVKTRRTSMNTIQETPNVQSSINMSSNMSLGQKPFEELPLLVADAAMAQMKKITCMVEANGQNNCFCSNAMKKERGSQKGHEVTGRKEKNTTKGITNVPSQLDCREINKGHLHRASTAKVACQMSSERGGQSFMAVKRRRKSVPILRNPHPSTLDCLAAKRNHCSDVRRRSVDQNWLPNIGIRGSDRKRVYQIDRKLGQIERKLQGQKDMDQIDKVLQHIATGRDNDCGNKVCWNIATESAKSMVQKKTTEDYMSANSTDFGDIGMKSNKIRTRNGEGLYNSISQCRNSKGFKRVMFKVGEDEIINSLQ